MAVASVSLAAMFAAPLAAQQSATPQPAAANGAAETPEAVEVRQKYIQIQSRLESAQREALTKENVKERQARHDKAVRSAMIEDNAQVGELLEAQDGLVAELSKSKELSLPAEDRSDAFNAKFATYQQQRAQIQAAAQKVSQQPEVAASLQKFQQELNTEVAKIEPDFEQLIQQRNELAAQYQQLVQSSR